MSREPYRRGGVFWAPDPYREGTNPRPWLVLAADGLPYPGEEYICVALTTTDLPENHRVGDAWTRGHDSETTSYCSPWVIGTIKDGAVESPQGSISAEFTRQMRDECRAYLDS